MQSLIYLLVTLAILVVVHEYGHFWVARRCGVKVLKFSVGFGKPLWRRVGKDGTEYSVAAIPLGGFVKMLDEREGEVSETELEQAFNRKSLAARSAIVAAGPVANLLFAIAAYWLIFVIGIPGQKPIIADVVMDSPAYQAQLVSGDEITAVNGHETPTWASVRRALFETAIEGGKVKLQVLAGSQQRNLTLAIAKQDFTNTSTSLLESLGIQPIVIQFEPIIASVVENQPAQLSGMEQGDKIISIDGNTINSWSDVVTIVQANPNVTLNMVVERESQYIDLVVTPAVSEQNKGKIGAMVDSSQTTIADDLLATERYGFIEAFIKASYQTWTFSVTTLKSIVGMISGDVSSKNIGGPVTIAQFAGASAEQGFISFVSFLAMISISLGLLNLLPIPVLDGGHLSLYLIEWLRGKPLSEGVQLQLQTGGIVLLAMLMFLAFFNDLSRLFG
jgi:regulator of sigma E protease